MPREAAKKTVKDFRAGFISEATALTFPDGSLVDLDNCDLEIKGSIRRRLGLDQEIDAFVVGPSKLTDLGQAVSYSIWNNPGNDPELDFIVFQIGNYLEVFNYNAVPMSNVASIDALVSGARSFVIDSTGSYKFTQKGFVNNKTIAERDQDGEITALSSTSGAGKLWLTSSAVAPFYMAYKPDTKEIVLRAIGQSIEENSTPYELKMQIRDFNGIDDNLEVNKRPAVLVDEHAYNLRNQTWHKKVKYAIHNREDSEEGDPLHRCVQEKSVYPSNSDILWNLVAGSAPDPETIGSLDPGDLLKQGTPTGRGPQGHFLLGVLDGSRDNIAYREYLESGFAGDPSDVYLIDFDGKYDEKSLSGFSSCSFFSGRLWVAGDQNSKRPNGIYFSQILRSPEDAGKFYQRQDPTARDFTDLLATDGGVIYLPDANNIVHMEPYGPGLCVFADNGVWFIYGGEGGFTATNFSVEKISSTGSLGKSSIVRTEKIILYWSFNSIYALALPERGVVPVVQDIAKDTIFGFYNRIKKNSRKKAQGCFDHISKKIFWCYLETPLDGVNNGYDKMLILDERTGAFTKYSFAVDSSSDFYIGPVIPQPDGVAPQAALTTTVFVGASPVFADTDEVLVHTAEVSTSDFINNVKVMLLNGVSGGVVLSEFYDQNFVDYSRLASQTADAYTSYFLTPPVTLDDEQVYKKAIYVHSFFDRTEEGFHTDTDGNLVATHPSGALMQAHWDWHNSNAGNRWTKKQQAYRYRVPYAPTGVDDNYDTGAGVVYSKLKVRGRGRAVSFRYESVDFKDMICLGYSTLYSKNTL